MKITFTTCEVKRAVRRLRTRQAAFCPTGKDGGIDNTCDPSNKGMGKIGDKKGYVELLDPHKIVLRETEQKPEDIQKLSDEVGSGPIENPIMAFKDSNNRINVIDGHHRALVAQRKNIPLPAIVISEKEYLDFIDQGYDDTQIKRAYAVYIKEKKDTEASMILKTDNVKVRFACANKTMAPTRDPLCMRKELIYEGRHEDGNNKRFTVTKDTIKYWVKAFNELNADGMEIPAPVEAASDGSHPQSLEDAQKNAHGTWLSFQEGTRPDGLACINAVVKFKDEATRDKLKDSDVSIFAENNYTGPNGKTYSTCITHAMFTDNPAIAGLSGFIACSRIETKTMTLLEFAQSIELVGEEATEEEAIDALKSALVKKADVEATETGEEEEEEEEIEASETDISDKAAKAIAAGRKAQIESLQASRKLDPKTAKEYLTEYTSVNRIKQDLKKDNQEFDKVIIACSRMPVNESLPVPGSTRTGVQKPIAASNTDSATVANAKKRAELAEKKRR